MKMQTFVFAVACLAFAGAVLAYVTRRARSGGKG
ncbi:hypothetical protein HY3_05540 [Hyphomonas pacifica]|uniref:Uncharacterized protein n=1 Tax=Hyphomonas pacifica TaxID=1280941 RepID=A0A8B2PKP5_9PROT|nr:hypothetical protein HY3_05540 [Hyphomonas pacifica]